MEQNYLLTEDYKRAEENGISKTAAARRFYDCGWSKEDAITKKTRAYDGKWRDLAESNGINKSTFYRRKTLGWSNERAATEPTDKRKSRKKLA